MRVAVVGGAGHVGLPLSLMLAKHGFPVWVIDSDHKKIEALRRCEFPFLEEGGPELLQELLPSGSITLSTDHRLIAECDIILLTIGTPLDEQLKPKLSLVYSAIDQIKPHLKKGQVLVLRSTLFPGTSEKILGRLRAAGVRISVCYCPERIAEGHALQELRTIPQIISAGDARGLESARKLFSPLAPELIELSLLEAELAKLFSNVWRYMKFAAVNQLYMVAAQNGLDFYKIRSAMMQNYPRSQDFPTAGFVAGPCLFKDAMQLASYVPRGFPLGLSAVRINENLPRFLVEQLKGRGPLKGSSIGILGMAFKAGSDDPRDSLAYRLRKLLLRERARVFCTDPYIQDADFLPLQKVLDSCRILLIGCPHPAYRGLPLKGHQVIDCWGILA